MTESSEKAPFTVVQQLSPDKVGLFATAAASVEPPVEFTVFDVATVEGAHAATGAIIASNQQAGALGEIYSYNNPRIELEPKAVIDSARHNGNMIIRLARPDGASNLTYFWSRLKELRSTEQA